MFCYIAGVGGTVASRLSKLWIRSDEGLTLGTSVFESLYGG